ncbi:hypothetical protein [Pelagicoccus sp. SDUM812005]|uniref:lipopolysaccharide biosynthesis protein n=1 Tax=Pelagicoccus sp. SDUM812005 TaxID=3041257 RepID=UPI00280DE48F|nr:hypothetical protein [Pelagicoccus sp. SDUM812005]MDQ8180651.1 hypothetical protein [Pelagicoccus sp. SDUM812005]
MSVASKPHRGIWDLLLVFFGKSATLLVVFAGGLMAARFGGASVYGGFVAGITLALLLDGVLGSAFDLRVLQVSSGELGDGGTESLQRAGFHLKWIVLACLLVIYLVSDAIWDFEGGSLPVWGAVAASFGIVLARSVALSLQMAGRFRLYSKLDVSQGALRMFGFCLLALFGAVSAEGFLFCYAAVGVLVVFWACGALGMRPVFGRLPSGKDASQFLSGLGAIFVVLALGAVTGRADLLALSLQVDESSLAAYGAASQLTQLLSQLALYACVVTQPKVVRVWERGALARYVVANVGAAVGVGALCGLAFWLGMGEFVVRLLFGEDFSATVGILEIMVWGGIVDLLVVPVFMTLGILKAPRMSAVAEAVVFIFFVVACGFLLGRGGLEWWLHGMAWIFVGTRLLKLVFYVAIVLGLRRPVVSAV